MQHLITVNGLEYVLKEPPSSDIRIVILQRGWVMVGRFSMDGEMCRLDDASVIRVWGTTKGLGELINGPTDKTILDSAGTVQFHILTVIAMLSVNQWPSLL